MNSINQQQPETLTTTSCVKKSLEPKPECFVTFSPAVNVRYTLHINDYSDDEFDACWFSDEDYSTMVNVIKCTINMIEKKVLIDEVNFSRRGIEGRTKEATVLCWESRLTALNAVLDEQQIQLAEGAHDDELLAIAYEECIYRSKITAYFTGIADEHFARAIHTPCRQNRARAATASRLLSCKSFFGASPESVSFPLPHKQMEQTELQLGRI
jgi:hypothetical protein